MKSDWIVVVECKVRKELCLANCTEKEAFQSPFIYAIDERELEQVDYEVISVKPNE